MNRTVLEGLMLRIKEGDEDAFAALYGETAKAVYAFILTYCRQRERAEDIMQDTFIRVKVNIDSYRGGDPLPWIMQIAKNLYFNSSQRERREIFTDFADDRGQYGSTGTEDTPILDLILNGLDEDEGRIATLYLVMGYKHREIAELTGKPLGTILWLYQKALIKLKKKIEKEGLL